MTLVGVFNSLDLRVGLAHRIPKARAVRYRYAPVIAAKSQQQRLGHTRGLL